VNAAVPWVAAVSNPVPVLFDVHYCVGIAKNSRLLEAAKSATEVAEEEFNKTQEKQMLLFQSIELVSRTVLGGIGHDVVLY
jgi:hypothetical protein